MVLLLNLIFAILAYLVADYLLGKARVEPPLRVVIAVLVALVVFFLDLAAQLH